MSTPDVDLQTEYMTVIQYCPLCGAVLDPDWPHVLCPICKLDQDEKWADYRAEREQAWHPD